MRLALWGNYSSSACSPGLCWRDRAALSHLGLLRRGRGPLLVTHLRRVRRRYPRALLYQSSTEETHASSLEPCVKAPTWCLARQTRPATRARLHSAAGASWAPRIRNPFDGRRVRHAIATTRLPRAGDRRPSGAEPRVSHRWIKAGRQPTTESRVSGGVDSTYVAGSLRISVGPAASLEKAGTPSSPSEHR